jgi:hypothetical protein
MKSERNKEKKIIITGATGQIGKPLSRALSEKGYSVKVFSRDPEHAKEAVPWASEYVRWHPETDDRAETVSGVYGVINLAGASIFASRLTRKYAEEVKASRITCISSLTEAMKSADIKPSVFINGSSQSYYGYRDRGNDPVNENSSAGNDWWSRDSALVEQEALKAESLGVRTVNIRTGYVLDSRGNGLPGQVSRFRKGQSSVLTPADSWRPWIHIEDEVNLIIFALENDSLSGPLNASAPDTVTNTGFTAALAKELNVPVKGKMPGAVLKLIMGNAATVFSKGTRIVPEKAVSAGYEFRFPKLKTALNDLVSRMEEPRSA